MSNDELKGRSVVTLPIRTEKWQEDILFKRFELCRNIYNAMLGYELKQYRKMVQEQKYKESLEIIFSAYKIENEKEKKKFKKTEAYKEAVATQRDYLREYGFSEFGFTKTVGNFYKIFSQNISSTMAGLSIAKPMWAAFEKMLFGNGNMVHFKKYDTWNSIVTDGKSGIRIVNEEEKTVLHRNGNEKLYVLMGGQKGKKLKMPIKIDSKDYYALEMLDRDIKTVRITRKKVRGVYKYYVQLCVVGPPTVKYDISTGEIKNPVGEGRVGVYIDTTSVTVYSDQGKTYFDLSEGFDVQEEKIADLQRYLDNSRRISNPDNYNPDGTTKKGQMKNGKRVRLQWTYSNEYKKTKDELANLHRMISEKRNLQRNLIANKILKLGCEIVVNDYPFQYAAMRKKEDEFSESGKPLSKKKAGKAIGQNAPATLVMLLDQKLKSQGYDGVTKVKLSDIDYSEAGYRDFYAKEFYEVLS